MAEVGQYKVAFLKKGDSYLYSKMFSQINDAVNFGLSQNYWLLFRNKTPENATRDYTWELLPYGNYKMYNFSLLIAKYKYVIFAIIAVYVLYKLKRHAATPVSL